MITKATEVTACQKEVTRGLTHTARLALSTHTRNTGARSALPLPPPSCMHIKSARRTGAAGKASLGMLSESFFSPPGSLP